MVSYLTFDMGGGGESMNFQKEISNMMHGFGDNPNPNAATVVLVETIVLQQLRSLLQEALQNSIKRGSQIITNYDLIYLMRKNILKLKRLYEYQLKLDTIDAKARQNSLSEGLTGIVDEQNKIKRTHINIIKEIDETGEVEQMNLDVIGYLRQVRAAKITETMPFDKYEAYHKARCSSFTGVGGRKKNFARLENWVNPTQELKISILALEVLSFIAYETVAEIVDAVFFIRQDSKRKACDPFSKYQGGNFCSPSSLSNAVYIKSGYEGVSAITVAEVREVIRRYFTPQTGTNGLFFRSTTQDVPNRYIAF